MKLYAAARGNCWKHSVQLERGAAAGCRAATPVLIKLNMQKADACSWSTIF